nr:AAA family ATPase [Actinomycetota bacterium]
LRDGSEVNVGARYSDPGYYVSEGKQRQHATGAYYMSAGLDGVQTVEEDPSSPGRVFVTDQNGATAAYDHTRGLAADESGEKEKTPAQMGAVMAGTRRALENDPSALAGQYRDAYDAYMGLRTPENNVRATDAYYAWAKAEGNEVGYSHDATVADIADHRRRKEEEEKEARASLANAAAQAAQAKGSGAAVGGRGGFNADHQKLLQLGEVSPVTDGEQRFSAEELRRVPEADPSFVMSASHEEVARDMGVARTLGFRSFAVAGEPGTGKNFVLEQLSAAEGRPHVEIDVDETTDVSELFGAATMKDNSIVWQDGKITHALKNGHRVVLNEANTAPVEVMTQFHNVAGSGNSAESRFIMVKSPEAGETVIPVHPDSEIVFTFNPEGTGREGGLGRALADRVEHFRMRRPNADEGARVVASQANKFLGKAGKGPIPAEEAKKCIGFFDDLRGAYRDAQPGIAKEPDTRWLHRFAAFRAVGGREMALRRCEEFLDSSSAGAGEAEQMRQSIRDLYDRRFGRS